MLPSLNVVGHFHVAKCFALVAQAITIRQVHLRKNKNEPNFKSHTAQQLHGCALTLEDVMPPNLAKLPTAFEPVRTATWLYCDIIYDIYIYINN